MRDTLTFLSELACNNNREWFADNKKRYDACRKRFEVFTIEYIRRLTEIDDTLEGLQPKDCIWRIYRDVRFSADKRPYKEWFGVFPAAKGGKKSIRGGYYFHLQPNHCLFSCGIWCPPADLLKALRREVASNYEEIEGIMASASWKRYFGDFDTDDMLKKVPAGFDPDFVHADWLKRKSYTCTTPLSDEDVCSPRLMDMLIARAQAAKPMLDFLNYTFEEYGEFSARCGR